MPRSEKIFATRMSRPLFKKSIEELEQLFRDCANSSDQLRILASELVHRKSKRAATLLKEVVEVLAKPDDASGCQTDDPPNGGDSGDPNESESRNTRSSRQQSQTRNKPFQEFTPPDQFTLIQPMGVRPRPSAFRPTLQNDLQLPITPSDSPTKIFRVALAELIREMKRRRVTIIDTSRIWPFTTRNAFNSRLNLMHALALRNLVLHLRDKGRIEDEKGKGRIGICTPYAAQAKLLREILKAHAIDNATVRASTVHGFQGDERPLMILDLVDSVGERNAGIFLQANQLNDSGAKLTNVALSRAQEGLIVLANLTWLDQKLPSDAILRGLLHDIQRSAQIVDVREILALRPIIEDLKRFSRQPELDPECLRTGLFGNSDFKKLCRLDMESAKKSIVVFSGFITQERAAQMGDLFRQKIAHGVKVRCVTRPPDRNGTIPEAQGRAALAALESLGVAIDLRNDIHEKAVLIDNKVSWFGSLNPLSHTLRTSELMARVDNAGVASHIASVLSIRRRSAEDLEQGIFAEPENPRCEQCSGLSVLIRGKHGPFFSCANGCNWKQNLDGPSRKKN